MRIKKFQYKISMLLVMAVLILNNTGCGNSDNQTSDELLENTTFVTDISELTVGESVQIVGLGEASHGTSEYQLLKGDVFKALVSNNGCRVFAIEGDFGDCAKVNDYINGREGTAQKVVAEIGFKIYQTQEMADLVDWMRTYNETAPDGQDLKFYGFDAQMYDNNKELLFEYLEAYVPSLSQDYFSKFAALTDADMYTLDNSALSQAEDDIIMLMDEMENQKPFEMDAKAQLEYDVAIGYAQSILDNTRLRAETSTYNELRDNIMAKKVEWIEQHEDGLIFINGHNGHIGKQSVSGYTCMGELLDQKYSEAYFPIGTDALNTVFNARGNNEYKEFTVENSNIFTDQLEGLAENYYNINFSSVDQYEDWQNALIEPQLMTALNVEFSSLQKAAKQFYTLEVTPSEAYSAVIIFKNTSSTNLIN